MTRNNKIYDMPFSKVYPMYIQKVERKGRTKEEVDEIITWLTGYTKEELQNQIDTGVTFTTFFTDAPKLEVARKNITGVICGVRVEDIKEPLMQEIRYLDKLVDEIAKGKHLEKIRNKLRG